MTLLSIVQSAADDIGLPRPNAIMSGTDPTTRALLRFANRAGREIARAGDWQALRRESTFTSVATETQTAMVPTDLLRFVDETFWNRSRRRMFYGPLPSGEWQSMKAQTTSPVVDTFTVRGGNILMNPVPAAGQTFAFEYIRNTFCTDSTGVTYRTAWSVDTDLAILDEELFTLYIVWAFKKARGLEWQTDFAVFESQLVQALRNERPRRTVDMSMSGWPRPPGISIPDGTWSP